MSWFLATLLLLVEYASAQNANCDFVQNVQVGQTYYVTSPNYPNSYTPGVQCRWIATCPTGYNCRLDCNLGLPQSTSCSLDRLLVSRTGDTQLNGADYYCGTGTLTAVSTGQKISVGLITALTSPGGRFLCQLRAQLANTGGSCSCGWRKQNRIVGGVETGVNEYPMMVGIADKRISQIKCGGVIISNRHVLTAAHCFAGQNINNFAIIVGEHNVTIGDSPATRGYVISNLISHPLYTETNYDYDIAILTTSENIVFSDRVGPVCLPFKFATTNLAGAKLTILGWGTYFAGGPTATALRKVDVDVISQTTCLNTVPTLTPRQICTYTPGKDACQDDSGGPLLYYDSATGALFNMGIVSSGRFCAELGQPGVNTRVTSLLNWIVSNTPGTNYCYK